VALADLLDLGEPGVALGLGAVQLDDQRSRDADRVAGVHGLLGRLDRERVHHLHGGGHDPRTDDVADDVTGRPDRGEVGEQRPHRLRGAQQPHDDLRRDPSVPSDPRNTPRRSGPACSPVSEPRRHHRPVGQHDLELQHVVRGEPVLEAVRAAGVLRDVAADRADLLAARVGRVVEPVRRGRGGDLQVRDAGLDGRAAVDRVDLQDPLEPGQGDDDAVRDGQRPPDRPVPAPRATKGTRCSAQTRTAAATCAASRGAAPARGRPGSR
jgi:hypothetical protein